MNKKHKIALLVIGILLCFAICLSASYAFYIFNVSQESTNIVQTDCFRVTYTDYNTINLDNQIPLSDEEAMELTPYTFTISNVCNYGVDYYINLETLNGSTMDLDGIRIRIDKSRSVILGSIEDNDSSVFINNDVLSSKTIKQGSMAANASKTFNLRIYIDEDSTYEQTGNKTYSSKVVLSTRLNPNYSEAILEQGTTFSKKLKELSGDTNPSYNSNNTSITSIVKSLSAPTESDNYINIESRLSSKPIYAWYNDGTIYLYCENEKIFLNSNSSSMFNSFKSLVNLDLSYFDTSKVTTMESMFYKTESIESLDLSHFDTSNVTSTRYMFNCAKNLTSLDISNFDTSSVTNMNGMFWGLENLIELDVSGFDTSNVTDMSYLFYNMETITQLDVSHFDTSKVTSMHDMFSGLDNVLELDVSNFNTSSVTNMNSMFLYCPKIKTLDVSKWDTSNVTNMGNLFFSDEELETLNVSSFNTSKVTNMGGMFAGLKKITSLDLSHFDTSNVETMGQMFNGSSALTYLNTSNFNTSKVTNMRLMFASLYGLTSLDLSNFDTTNVTNMEAMFGDCKNLTSLILGPNFNTSKVTTMELMFSGLESLETIDLSTFDTSLVTTMEAMFVRGGFRALDLSNFDTTNVTKMGAMFASCKNLDSLDLTSFNTSNLAKVSSKKTCGPTCWDWKNSGMFENMNSLRTIYVSSNWDSSHITDGETMFKNTPNIVGTFGTTYDENHVDKEYAHLDGGTSNPGYFSEYSQNT